MGSAQNGQGIMGVAYALRAGFGLDGSGLTGAEVRGHGVVWQGLSLFSFHDASHQILIGDVLIV